MASRRRRARTAVSPDPFRHVVLLMLENRSFDHMLGGLQRLLPELDGVPPQTPPRTNADPAGRSYPQRAGAARALGRDPMHETPNVLRQLEGGNGGFVSDFARHYPDSAPAERQEVMAYHAAGTLPALHTLARTFAVFDGWFCSVPGPTWTNRLFALSGTSQGRVRMPEGIFRPNLHRYDQPSVFRRLREAKRSFRVYHGGFPLALLLADQRRIGSVRRYHTMRAFFAHAAGDAAEFPDFAFVEPDYLGGDANDDHPPHDVLAGQGLVASVYDALRANAALWESTLLVVTYDEHGGFYDHRAPGRAVPPDGHAEEYTFDRLGVRVPAVLVSPWLPPQVVKTTLDHTSLLRYLSDKWALGPMGERVVRALPILDGVRLAAAPRSDTPVRLAAATGPPRRRAAAPARAVAARHLTDHEKAIVAFSAYLDQQTPGPAPRRLELFHRAMRSPDDSRAVARERAARFLRARGAPTDVAVASRRRPRTRG